jgi:hypothetical protein
LAVVDADGLLAAQGGSNEETRGRTSAPGTELWQRGLGYRRLTRNQVRQLQSKYPVLSYHAPSSAFYAKPLPVAKASSRQRQVAGAEKAGEAAVVGAALSLQSRSSRDKVQEQQEQQQQQQPKRRHSHWRLRLWGWAARKLVNGVTFGLLGS